MSKISRIKISNFKSISDFEADFKGCTAMVVGGNNTGKSSFLKGIVDRIRFIRPDVPVKQGEKEGSGEMVLTNGDKFVWQFDGVLKDKLTLITHEGLKHTVTKEIGAKYFPAPFDIDKFLQSSPKQQVAQLQKIVGLDFTEIDARYEKAYNFRTERNRDAELYHAKLAKMIKCDSVEFVDLTELQANKAKERARLNELYLQNKAANDKVRAEWNAEKERILKEVIDFNTQQEKLHSNWQDCNNALRLLTKHGYSGDASEFVQSLFEKIQPAKVASELFPVEPTYIQEMPDQSVLEAIDKQIVDASQINASAQKYKEYIDHVTATDKAYEIAKQADAEVRAIEAERKAMIESVAMPEGVTFGTDGILVDGLPLDRTQISTSKLYTAALRIAAMNIGDVKTLYFDASYLDRKSLAEIEEWANANDLQLLIERPDFDAGELRYEIIETSSTLEPVSHE